MSNRAFKLTIVAALGIAAYIWWKQRNEKANAPKTILTPSGTSQPAMGMFPQVGFLAPAAFNGTGLNN